MPVLAGKVAHRPALATLTDCSSSTPSSACVADKRIQQAGTLLALQSQPHAGPQSLGEQLASAPGALRTACPARRCSRCRRLTAQALQPQTAATGPERVDPLPSSSPAARPGAWPAQQRCRRTTDSPDRASLTTDTVRPAELLVPPHMYMPRGAAWEAACDRTPVLSMLGCERPSRLCQIYCQQPSSRLQASSLRSQEQTAPAGADSCPGRGRRR